MLFRSGCSRLTSVTIPGSVTSIGGSAFSGCSGLKSVIIGNGVTSIGEGAFWNCSGLISVHINSNAIVSSNRTGSNNLKTIFGNQVREYVIGENVTSIGNYAFYKCSDLTSVSIPSSVTSIGIDVFWGCNSLTLVTVYMVTPVKITQNTFGNRAKATLNVPKGSKSAYQNADYWKEFKNIVEMEIPCATPTISYVEGKLVFECETAGATIRSSITSDDFSEFVGNEVELTVAYNISAYAVANNYNDSPVATATLCWIDTEPIQGVVTGTMEIPATPVLIKSQNGEISVTGLADGTQVNFYTADGMLVGSAKVTDGSATLHTNLAPGTVVIVNMGKKAVKFVVR